MIQNSGYPGASVNSLASWGLSAVADFEPDLVILDIGTNGLSSKSPDAVATAISDLVDDLIDKNGVKFVAVLQILHRQFMSDTL